MFDVQQPFGAHFHHEKGVLSGCKLGHGGYNGMQPARGKGKQIPG